MKKINFKNIKKIGIGVFLSLIIFFLGIFAYSYIFEQDKIAIDKYNFEQLEKVKGLLKYKLITFKNLKEFNKQYGSDIKPIKNCYYMNRDNGKYPYIFGFELESSIYKLKNMGKNYAYPGYDIVKEKLCMGEGQTGGECVEDLGLRRFLITISNPCN